jgi:prevent-host-death family protein
LIVLDTHVISELMRRQPEPRVLAWADGLDPEDVVITSMLATSAANLHREPAWAGRPARRVRFPSAPQQPERLLATPHQAILTIMIIVVSMIRETSAVVFRQNLGEMLNQVQYRHDSILINRDGKPVAALIDAPLFERIRRLQARFDGLCARIEAGCAEVPEAQGLAEIEAAVAASRAGH